MGLGAGQRRVFVRGFWFLLVSALAMMTALAGDPPKEGDAAKPPASAEQERERRAREGRTTQTALTQSIQGESGLSVQTMCTNCNSADLSLGGLGNEHIAMVCDGVPVPAGLAQIYLLSVMPPTVIDNVEVEKGAGRAALDGGAIGGEVEITRRKPEPGLQVRANADTGSYGWNAARADVSGAIGWFGAAIAAAYNESDRVFADDDTTPDSPGFERKTIDGRLRFQLARDHEIRVGTSLYEEEQEEGRAAYDSLSGLWNLENVDFDLRQYDLVYEGRFDDGSRLSVMGAWAERDAFIEETIPFTLPLAERQYFPSYDILDERKQGEASYSRLFGTSTIARAGASWTRRQMDVVDVRKNLFDVFKGLPFSEVFTRTQGEVVTESGAYAEVETSLGPSMVLAGGLRYVDYEYEDNIDEIFEYDTPSVQEAWAALALPEGSRVIPRVSFDWKPVPSWTLRASVGAGYRLPEPTYEEVCCGRRFRGNRGVEIERSWSYGIEARYQPSPRFSAETSLFYTDFEDLVVHMVTIASQYTATYQNVNVPQARYLALSAQARGEVTSWLALKGSFTLLDATNETVGDAIPAIILNQSNLPEARTFTSDRIPYAVERSGAAGVEFRAQRVGFTASIDTQYKGDVLIQQFTPDLFGSEDVLAFRESEDFFVTNVRVTQRLGAGIELFAGVDNVEDYVQSDLRDPRTDYTWGPLRGRYYYGGVSFRFDGLR